MSLLVAFVHVAYTQGLESTIISFGANLRVNLHQTEVLGSNCILSKEQGQKVQNCRNQPCLCREFQSARGENPDPSIRSARSFQLFPSVGLDDPKVQSDR